MEDKTLPKDLLIPERVDGKTLNGGDYAVAFYNTKKMKPCKKEDAKIMKIVEYKEDGTFVNCVIGMINQ